MEKWRYRQMIFTKCVTNCHACFKKICLRLRTINLSCCVIIYFIVTIWYQNLNNGLFTNKNEKTNSKYKQNNQLFIVIIPLGFNELSDPINEF